MDVVSDWKMGGSPSFVCGGRVFGSPSLVSGGRVVGSPSFVSGGRIGVLWGVGGGCSV